MTWSILFLFQFFYMLVSYFGGKYVKQALRRSGQLVTQCRPTSFEGPWLARRTPKSSGSGRSINDSSCLQT